jgi:hypothetical protein
MEFSIKVIVVMALGLIIFLVLVAIVINGSGQTGGMISGIFDSIGDILNLGKASSGSPPV